MHWTTLLAVLSTLIVSANTVEKSIGNAPRRLLAVLIAMTMVVAFAVGGSVLITRRVKEDKRRLRHWFSYYKSFRHIHLILWLAVCGAILIGLQWPRLVRFDFALQQAILLDELLILAPLIISWFLSCAAFHRVEHAIDPQGVSSCRDYLLRHYRQQFGLMLPPLLATAGLLDLVAWLAPAGFTSNSAWPLYAAPLVLVAIAFPALFRACWRTEPLPDGPLRRRLQQAARTVGLQVRDILVWRTGGRLANAAVLGLTPRLRYVLLTDGLLEQLDDDEVEAIFLHEAGHVRRRHVLWRLFVLTAPLWILLWIMAAFPQTLEQVRFWCMSYGLDEATVQHVVAPLALVGYAVVSLAYCCRLMEYDADLWACRILARQRGDATQAIQCFARALTKMSDANNARGTSWLHPALDARLRLLEQRAASG